MATEISLEPMEESEELVKDIKNMELDKSHERSIAIMKRDLSDYRKRMGNKATYKGWLAHLVPENLILDDRLDNTECEYNKLWQESSRRLTRKRQLRNRRNQTGKKEMTNDKDIKEN